MVTILIYRIIVNKCLQIESRILIVDKLIGFNYLIFLIYQKAQPTTNVLSKMTKAITVVEINRIKTGNIKLYL